MPHELLNSEHRHTVLAFCFWVLGKRVDEVQIIREKFFAYRHTNIKYSDILPFKILSFDRLKCRKNFVFSILVEVRNKQISEGGKKEEKKEERRRVREIK
jgi:hypothetical protein